jgi:hypothetical protein
MSLYALNLFDLEENDLYRHYSRRSPEALSLSMAAGSWPWVG